MKVGFIGCGNMAEAILCGCLRKSFFEPENVMACEIDLNRLAYITNKWGIQSAANIFELLDFANVVFLAVKPHTLPIILSDVGIKAVEKRITFVSVAAGKSLLQIEQMLAQKVPVVRVMPNLNVQICEGTTAICVNPLVTAENKMYVTSMFQAVGSVHEIPEEQFPVFSAIAGCSPAFTYMYIDALARSATRLGMSKKLASEVAAAAVAGSAKNLSQSVLHAWELIDQVCSPGGVTVEGIAALQEGRFEVAVSNAVRACVYKDKSL